MASIKRSMAVHPAPIVMEGGRPRHPHLHERKIDHKHEEGFAPWTGLWGYRISRVTNSVVYRPGFLLMAKDVEKLIEDGWTVSVLSKR